MINKNKFKYIEAMSKIFDDFKFEEYDRPFRDTDTGKLIRDIVIWNDKNEERMINRYDIIHLERSSSSFQILWVEKYDEYVRVNITEYDVNSLVIDLIKAVKRKGYEIKQRKDIDGYDKTMLCMQFKEENISDISGYLNKDNFLDILINDLDEKRIDILPFGDLYVNHSDGYVLVELHIWIGK